MKPTEEQQKIVDSQQGRILVKACPGSGKTATLVKRTIALPEASEKLVLAFNKAAAVEFSSRLGKTNAKVLTFHSFCLREISKNPASYGFTEIPTIWQKGNFQLVKAGCTITKARGWEEAGLDEDIYKMCAHSTYTHELDDLIQRNKPRMTNDEYSKIERDIVEAVEDGKSMYEIDELRGMHKSEKQRRIEYRTYRAVKATRAFCMQYNIITFDDMVRCVAEKRHNLINKADHIMVDEFQDVDRFQFDIIKILGKSPDVISLAVVGDPNQSIYRWRGALSNAFEDFAKSFANSTECLLTKNFRSTDEIIIHSDNICPVGMTGVRGSGESVLFESDVYDKFLKKSDGTNYRQFAILHRYNKDVEDTKKLMMELDIPFYVIGKDSNFWNQKHVTLSLRMKERGLNLDRLLRSEPWQQMMNKKKFRDNQDAVDEARADAEFIMSIDLDEVDKLKNCHQNEKHGVRLSTIHKTKGMEWENVMVRFVDERLIHDTFLYYVACTRARNLLVLDYIEECQ
jgi:superfamily I DNA/RNA helicase